MHDEELAVQELPPTTREALFRLAQRNSLMKWMIGTVGLTLITTIGSWYFQNREVKLAEVEFAHEQQMRKLEFEQKYLGEFLEYAIVEDLDARLRFAHYFKSVTTDPTLKQHWTSYHAELVTSLPKSEEDAGSRAIGGVEALTGRKITRVWLGAEAVDTIAGFHAEHVDKLGWSDVGFHYYVDLTGQVKLARPVGRTPAFVKSHNTNAIAVALACEGWEKASTPTPAGHQCELTAQQQEAVQTLVSKLLEDHGLSPDVIGKRSDYRPVPDLLGGYVTELQDRLMGPRPRQL